MDVLNAIIRRAELSSDDHGVLSGWVHVDLGGSSQGFGGIVLYLPKAARNHRLMSPAGHWIWRVMEVAGVTSWGDLPGKTIRIQKEDYNSPIVKIGHIVKNDWFCPSEDFAGGE